MTGSKDSKATPTRLVRVELCPVGGVDVLGDPTDPLLIRGVAESFTTAEADALMTLTNSHGTPICRIVRGA